TLSLSYAVLALRRLRCAFMRAAWTARWRSRFGSSPRAPWVALGALSVLVVAATLIVESFAQGGFKPVLLLVALVFEMILFIVSVRSVVVASDAAVGRATAERVAASERRLLSCRL